MAATDAVTVPREKKVSISCRGETTATNYSGLFRFKLVLSHKEQLLRDEVRRRLLGADAASASVRAADQALIFSELQAHVLEAPKWWSIADAGLELEDDAPVRVVYEELQKAKAEFQAAVRAQIDGDKEAIKELAPKPADAVAK